jgi:hypothetical protein
MIVRLAVRTTLLLPKDVRSLTQVPIASTMPVFLCSPRRASLNFPEGVGVLSDDLIQARLGL